MLRGTTIADPELPVKLKDQELLDRGQHLAEMISQRAEMKSAKDRENKKRQGEIDELDEEIARLARVLIDGAENRAQMDLFADQLSPDEAKRRLLEVAARAAKHPFVPSETAIDTCAREGCGALQAADVHVAPVPSEPHTFVPDGSGEAKCWACESGKDDPVHAEPAAAEAPDPNAPHAAVLGDQPEGEEKACLFCTRAVDDPIHEQLALDPASEVPGTVEKAEAAFLCADCADSGASLEASMHPKSEGMWMDADARVVCANCRQVAIEAGRWPHPFKAGHPKAKKCSDCGYGPGDKLHFDPEPPAVTEEPAVAAPTGDPAYDFTAEEPAPAVIASAKAIETPAADEPAKA